MVPSWSCTLAVAFAGSLTVVTWAAKHDKTDPPVPAVRISTLPLEYHPLSSFYLMSRTSSSSLNFIDNQHLLFTFRVTGLLKRLPECRSDDEDQLVRALVVHLPDGKVERSAEWRLHDRGRYLWQLGDGKFLVRQRDTLLTTDSSLELQPFLQSNSAIRLVKLSPDSRMLLVESDAEHQRVAEPAGAEGLLGPRQDVQLTVLRIEDGSVMLRARALNVTDLPMISHGYLEALSSRGDHWMVRYRPFQGEPTVIADVASACRPGESALNDETAVVSSCEEHGGDHIFQAISLGGKKLWTYRWDDHYVWPTTAASESGTRIAFSALRVAHPVNALDPLDETELQAQRVEVLDVATGQLELTQYATPVLSAGQNYALSPDGGRFAVLRDNAIEIYNLPAVAPERASVE